MNIPTINITKKEAPSPGSTEVLDNLQLSQQFFRIIKFLYRPPIPHLGHFPLNTVLLIEILGYLYLLFIKNYKNLTYRINVEYSHLRPIHI